MIIPVRLSSDNADFYEPTAPVEADKTLFILWEIFLQIT
jgi:hypothetical protein